jgi:gliding motility-associated-like protein
MKQISGSSNFLLTQRTDLNGWLQPVCMLLLLLWCHSGLAQDTVISKEAVKREGQKVEAVEANFQSFPATEKISSAIWEKVNPGKKYNERTCYQTFKDDTAKYVEVVSKRNAFESFYINPAHPTEYSLVKALDPINFQRNGEWIAVDAQLKPVGNNVYEATDQWDPVGINVTAKESYIITANGKVQFNDWTLYGVNNSDKILLAKADWSHYTIGADGIRIINIFPGIDAEMRVSRGGVKTSFIIHRLNFTQYQELHFEDDFKGLHDKGLYFTGGNKTGGSIEAVYANENAIKISPAFGYVKKSPAIVTPFPFHISNNKLSVAVPVEYITNTLTAGDVVIDPLVQSTNSIAASTVGAMYNASCSFANSCDYTIAITPPANATITQIASSVYIVANAPCGRENFAWQVSTGTCVSPGPGRIWFYSATGPGTAWAGYFGESALMACAPAPSCSPTPINVLFKLFRGCVGPTGCDNTCIGLVNPLAVRISGHTAELTAITASATSDCQGQNFTFSTSTAYGVPPFSAINWSYDPSGTPSLGTGTSITTGAALAPGSYTIYANATDACGTVATANLPFTVKPIPVASTGAAGETICNGGTFSLTPSSSVTGTTYSWAVTQAGVTGATAGSGTSISQTLSNSGNTPGTAVYGITPTANGCTGSPITYTVTVKSVNNVLYVDDVNGNDAYCGDSWGTALKTLSKALTIARGSTNVDSILVAKGTYYPTGVQNGTNRDSSFVILRGTLKMYGGYPSGGGTRDIAGNPTILSGDIGRLNDSTDNSYHVMVIAGNIPATADSIVVDGFTITKGNADGTGTVNYGSSGVYQGHGGGMFMIQNATGQKTALRNLTFTSNTAKILGGGVEINTASPYIQNCVFTNNHSVGYGGALSNEIQTSPAVIGCSFTGNTANNLGGAVYTQNNNSSPVFTNCSFTGNMAMPLPPGTTLTFGGAMFNNTGAVVNISHCIFTSNKSTGGGGALIDDNNATTTITYSVFDGNICVNGAGNIGSGGGLQINGAGGTISLFNSVVVNNVAGGTGDDAGGGIMVYSGTFNCDNVTLLGNTTQSAVKPNGNGISVVAGATMNFNNSIVWGNPAQEVHNLGTLNYNYSLVKGLTTTLPNLNIDPQFVNAGNPIGADGIWGTADDGLQLTNCSPAVNMGSNALIPAGITTDEAGNARIFGPAVDMGAYELQTIPATINFTNIIKTYGDPDAAVPNVTNCSGLPLTFTITDNTIATIVTGNLHILKAGATTITAHTTNGAPDVTVNLTVNRKPVTLSLTSTPVTKVYDGNTNATISTSNLQFAPGDVVGTDDVAIALSSNLAFYDTKDVGTGKTVRVPLGNISLTGTTAANYVISNTTDVSAATGVITPLAITVTADVQSKVYGNVDPALTYTHTPALVAGDAFTGSLTRVPGENVGTYSINQGTLTLGGNYTITYNTNNLTITPKAIAITADAKTKVYGDADPALTYTYTPALIAGDAFTGSLVRISGENVGTYSINQGTLTLSSNYTITYNTNNLTITPKAITITADAKTKTYGDADPALTYAYTPALIGGDAFTGSLVRISGENVGTYSINQGTLTLSGNYTITYNTNNLTITPKAITITADAKTKTYGDADPALTYTYSPALAFSDAFTGALNRMPGENAGAYTILQNTLALNNNYQVTYVSANLVIDKALLTVTATNKTICLNDVLTSVPVTYTGFKYSDNTASLKKEPVVRIPSYNTAGTYDLMPVGGSADNYIFNYVNGQLTVLPVATGGISQAPIGPGIVNTPNVTSGMQLVAPTSPGYNYTWSTGETASAIVVKSSGDYWVSITNPVGCTVKFITQVKQLTLIIPNIFSPNGDGIHDKWVIENLENYPGNIVQIYNRYGQLLYKVVNYTPWDGKVNGNDVPVGTYYYIIDPKNGQKPVTGFIDIIR